MINLHENLTRRNILIFALVVIIMLFIELLLMRGVRSYSAKVDETKRNADNTERMLKSQTDTVMKFKSSMGSDYSLLPNKLQNPTKFYSLLINTLSVAGMGNASVSRAEDADGMVSFNVNGEAPYFSLLDLLAGLRKSAYMMRLTKLEINGEKNGKVGYSMTVQGVVENISSGDVASGGANQ
jgi:hypothetical protein